MRAAKRGGGVSKPKTVMEARHTGRARSASLRVLWCVVPCGWFEGGFKGLTMSAAMPCTIKRQSAKAPKRQSATGVSSLESRSSPDRSSHRQGGFFIHRSRARGGPAPVPQPTHDRVRRALALGLTPVSGVPASSCLHSHARATVRALGLFDATTEALSTFICAAPLHTKSIEGFRAVVSASTVPRSAPLPSDHGKLVPNSGFRWSDLTTVVMPEPNAEPSPGDKS